MRELCEQARTIFIVSHALKSMRELTDEVIWIDAGQLRMRDDPDTVIEAYQEFLGVARNDQVALEDP